LGTRHGKKVGLTNNKRNTGRRQVRRDVGDLSEVGDGGLGAEDLDKLFFIGINVSLHDIHARTKNTFKRSHVQNYTHTHTYRHTQTYRETYREA